ncbi:hypothetical protein [Arthrobacter sp. zg-Y1110]|uniref:hypothetical protein n=1 Tax=Arthrobacter sp. zg-Y1110 TaxID=2886932 RepID=UPI001D137B33|nr:hypothetical protein [Arthrobacter sp. zg-Y1110]MCC3292929.1 hypothetical protein [Arthrobacter sp. zg-Y1110]UWX86868.1 hypothetical protein N2K99_18670 [Arthrobacter sp. zg-Y1110]
MDVSDIFAVEAAPIFTVALWLTGVFGALTALSFAVDRYRDIPGWVPAVGAILTFVSVFTAMISGSSPSDTRQSMMESGLFETYGITADAGEANWRDVNDAGGAGAMAEVTIDGRDVDVLIKLDGNRLTVIGDDGEELPANPGR